MTNTTAPAGEHGRLASTALSMATAPSGIPVTRAEYIAIAQVEALLAIAARIERLTAGR